MTSTRMPEPQLSAWRAVLNAHAALVARVEHALSAAGQPPLAWYDLLWALRRHGGRLRMNELADSLTISRGGLTKLADRLERAELIRRERCPEDRRGALAVLLPAGEEVLRRMWPVYANELRAHFGAVMDDEEAAIISEALNRVSASARETTTAPAI